VIVGLRYFSDFIWRQTRESRKTFPRWQVVRLVAVVWLVAYVFIYALQLPRRESSTARGCEYSEFRWW